MAGLRLPGAARRFDITRRRAALILGVLLIVPVAYALYLGVQLFRLEREVVVDRPTQASGAIATRPQGTAPVIVIPTTKPRPGGPTSAAGGSGTPTPPRVGTPPPVAPVTPAAVSTPVPGATPAPGAPTVAASTAGPNAAVTPYDPGRLVPTGVVPASTAAPVDSSIAEWHGKKRITMLLLGIDQRDDEPTRSDTIILASLDFEHNRAYVLSVPRDLYVEVPGFLYWKINAAYAIGENPEHTASVGGGVGLMMTTLRYNFGLKEIDQFGVIDFDGFVTSVDALGGIDINVPRRLADRRYPSGNGYMNVVFEKGPQHMDGETALRYARIRHSDSDFGRILRQQQVILAVQQKARNPALLVKAPALLNAIRENFRTDIGLGDQLRLARWGASLPRENIEFYTITGPIGSPEGSNQSVVVAEWDKINPLLKTVFGPEAGQP